MHLQACVVTPLLFALQFLLVRSSPQELTEPLSPLYRQDPHDVQRPLFPPPTCAPRTGYGIQISSAIESIGAFCVNEQSFVSADHQQPIIRSYSFYNSHGKHQDLQLALLWHDSGSCPRSQIIISPAQNAGALCKTVFNAILIQCK